MPKTYKNLYPEALTRALHGGRLLLLWGDLPFPLAARLPVDRRQGVLADLPPGTAPAGTGALHLPSLPPLPILSLDPGDRVERAFREAGVSLHVLRTEHDLPVGGRHNLLKLAGDLATRSGVVLSRAEIGALRSDAGKRHLLAEARRTVESGALLLLGCDPAHDDFHAWWAALAPVFGGAACFAVGDLSAPWPQGVTCLGPDLGAAGAALRAARTTAEPAPAARPPQPQTLTWLHLSDLHFRARHAYDENIVLQALLRDLAARVDGLRPDFIAVSGDIAFSGKPDEYGLARPFFDDLLAITGLAKDRLFLIPGNHDADRRFISRGAQGIAAALVERGSANEVLGDRADRGLMMARFEGYGAFLGDYLGDHLRFDGGAQGDAGYFYVRTLDIGAQRIAVLGLNSAWLARGGDEDRGQLLLGERQTRAALAQAEGADLKIALLHHPFDWLRAFDRDDSEAMLTDRCDFILHGHMHQVGLLQARGPDSKAMIIAAGACYESRQHPNAYNLVQLDLGSGRGTVHLRMYSDRRGGFWTKDVVNYRNVPDGLYTFSLPARHQT